MRQMTIGKNDSGQRLDKFLTKALPLLPQSLLYKSLRTKKIKVNGKRSEISYRLAEGDLVTFYLSDEFFDHPEPALAFLRAGEALDIVFEDPHLLVVNKPAGLVVHQDESNSPDTLIHRVLRYLYQSGQYDPAAEQSFTPSLCHRIDRNTSGLVVCAKDAATLRVMNEKIRGRELTKRYRCLVFGAPSPAHATKKAFLVRDEATHQVRVFDQPVPEGRTAITEYRVLGHRDGISLLEVVLHTGRTHQIRAHLAHLGHPLVGDSKYGTAKQNRGLPYRYQALCAYSLTFDFPTDPGHLAYIKGRTIQLSQLPFGLD